MKLMTLGDGKKNRLKLLHKTNTVTQYLSAELVFIHDKYINIFYIKLQEILYFQVQLALLTTYSFFKIIIENGHL